MEQARTNFDAFAKKHRISYAAIGRIIEKHRETARLKAIGQIPWTQDEINKMLRFVRDDCGLEITYEELWGAAA